jgi:hypothetical protein
MQEHKTNGLDAIRVHTLDNTTDNLDIVGIEHMNYSGPNSLFSFSFFNIFSGI